MRCLPIWPARIWPAQVQQGNRAAAALALLIDQAAKPTNAMATSIMLCQPTFITKAASQQAQAA
jgi:hypothetical protein